ncbi:ABC transporter permease [Mesorhizobium humile]|uniref:ABC transporter permease n=1 Tax=Mesorhizobium humile TaxID=3072313 RepID=A0ABU4YNL0_9HYPH|nr:MULTISPECIES: ABC transporter permease [unclassified Mesorhizobium]MDX8463164.1 ABC transporter permease [Mesorhizobium sp. VK2D]MDX8488537.1 ABC transporter permease [Mesorhizobium sp. VK2B]
MSAPDAARRKAGLRARLAPWLLMAPALLIAVAFFGLPIAFMARMSFNEHIDQRFYVPGFTFDNYAAMLTDQTFRGALFTTMRLALISSVVTVVIGYAFAMLVWLKPKRWRLAFIALALCPLLISEISIIFGWWMFFPKNGLLSYALVSSGLITDKISLMYTEFAAFVGLTYVTLPFCFFILLSIFDGIDKKVLEASADLGSAPLRTFYEVLLPLTKGGIAAAFAQSFIWAVGTYATPSALGPDTLWTIGYLIQEQMLGKHNWPRAAAFSIVLTIGVALVMVIVRALTSKRTALNG